MTYGENEALRARWHRGLVLLQRPLAAAFPRQAQGAPGGSGLFSRVLNQRDVPSRVAEGQRDPRADTKLLEEMVIAHRSEILEEWEGKVQPQ